MSQPAWRALVRLHVTRRRDAIASFKIGQGSRYTIAADADRILVIQVETAPKSLWYRAIAPIRPFQQVMLSSDGTYR